jgi:hypothetical protein
VPLANRGRVSTAAMKPYHGMGGEPMQHRPEDGDDEQERAHRGNNLAELGRSVEAHGEHERDAREDPAEQVRAAMRTRGV